MRSAFDSPRPFNSLCRLVGTYAPRAPVLTSTLPPCDPVGEYAAKEGLITLQGLLAIYWRVEVERCTQRIVGAPLSTGTLLNITSSSFLMLEIVNPNYSQYLDRRVAISSARKWCFCLTLCTATHFSSSGHRRPLRLRARL